MSSTPSAETPSKLEEAYIASAEHLKKALAPMNAEPVDQALPNLEKHLFSINKVHRRVFIFSMEYYGILKSYIAKGNQQKGSETFHRLNLHELLIW